MPSFHQTKAHDSDTQSAKCEAPSTTIERSRRAKVKDQLARPVLRDRRQFAVRARTTRSQRSVMATETTKMTMFFFKHSRSATHVLCRNGICFWWWCRTRIDALTFKCFFVYLESFVQTHGSFVFNCMLNIHYRFVKGLSYVYIFQWILF